MQHDDEPAAPATPGTPPAPTLADRIEALTARVHPVTWPLGLAAVVLAGATLLHFVDPGESDNPYPTCPWLMITGTFCPGCGTMRAVALLTHLDVAGALGMNLLLMLMLPYLAHTYVAWLIGTLRPRGRPTRPTPTWFVGAILASFVVFWIARNLPWFSFLAPGTPLLPTG